MFSSTENKLGLFSAEHEVLYGFEQFQEAGERYCSLTRRLGLPRDATVCRLADVQDELQGAQSLQCRGRAVDMV